MTLTSEDLRSVEREVVTLLPKADDPTQAAVKALAVCFVFSLVSSVLSGVGVPLFIREAIAATCAIAMVYADARAAERRYRLAYHEALQKIVEVDKERQPPSHEDGTAQRTRDQGDTMGTDA